MEKLREEIVEILLDNGSRYFSPQIHKQADRIISLMKKEAHSSVSSSAGLEGLQVDDDMLIRAVKEAVKVGILPKHGVSEETYLKHYDGIKKVLQAALAA